MPSRPLRSEILAPPPRGATKNSEWNVRFAMAPVSMHNILNSTDPWGLAESKSWKETILVQTLWEFNWSLHSILTVQSLLRRLYYWIYGSFRFCLRMVYFQSMFLAFLDELKELNIEGIKIFCMKIIKNLKIGKHELNNFSLKNWSLPLEIPHIYVSHCGSKVLFDLLLHELIQTYEHQSWT